MPNVWTHLLFGREVLNRIGESSLIEAPQHRNLFQMGCQGPDFLFYHNYLPWRKGKTMNKLGSRMHSEHCGPVLMEMLDAVAGRSVDRHEPDDAVVYMLGFVLHHTLDRNVHPYVFSRSGFRKWDHQRFEVMMDTLVVRRMTGLETWRTPVWKELDTGGAFPPAIVDAFEQIAAIYYPELARSIQRDAWNQANRDMVAAQRLFYDPTGIRRIATFGQIEPLVYKRRLPLLDILNVAGRPWTDPTDDRLKHSDTFDEMWDRAMDESEVIVRAVLDWLRHESSPDKNGEPFGACAKREHAASLIGNLSYETGKPCGTAEIRFADPIWPDGRGAHPETSRTGS